MTYATKQLTEGLQRISQREFQTPPPKNRRHLEELKISEEINLFLEERKNYREKIRPISVGDY